MILVLRALGLGDLATAVPALRGLRAAFPGQRLALAAPGWLAPVVELVGGIDLLLPTTEAVVREAVGDGGGPVGEGLPVPADGRGGTGRSGGLRAVNLHGRGPQSHRLLRATGADRLYAFRRPEAGEPDGPLWRDDEHEVHRWCRLLDWYGVPADPADLDLHRPDRTAPVPAGATVLHPGGKGDARRWSTRRFAALAAALERAGHRVVVTGTAGERHLARQVADGGGLPPERVLAGRLNLRELAALVAGARVVVSTDTGVAHLATAYRRPSVVLFGPVQPRHWGPPADRPWHRALWSPGPDVAEVPSEPGRSPEPGPAGGVPRAEPSGLAGNAICQPGGARLHPSLAAITVAQVYAAVHEVDQMERCPDAVATR